MTIERTKAAAAKGTGTGTGTVDLTNPKAQIWSPITDGPRIAMSYRDIGVDDLTGNAVPPFFAALGVHAGVAFNPEEPGDTQSNIPPNNRVLRACDYVLQQPRYALSAVTTVGDAIADGYDIITTLNIGPPDPSQKLMVYTTGQWTPTQTTIDPTTGVYQEPTYDEILIATLYLLSPPGMGQGDMPDATWTAYTQHNLFWNLSYGHNTNIQQPQNQQITFPIALPSAGLFEPIISAILAPVNDAVSQIEAQIAAHSLAGSFWTQGGCSPIATGTSTAEAPNYGLNKAAAVAAENAAASAAPAPLDPAFPYTCQQFPTQLLS